jgi:hypothetical protein
MQVIIVAYPKGKISKEQSRKKVKAKFFTS